MQLRKSGLLLFLMMLALCSQTDGVLADACTYQDAIMALQQGNQTRGLALMHMASRDGDGRARRYLVAEAPNPRSSQDKQARPFNLLAQQGR